VITLNKTEVATKSFQQIVDEMKARGEEPSPGLLMMAERERMYAKSTDDLIQYDE